MKGFASAEAPANAYPSVGTDMPDTVTEKVRRVLSLARQVENGSGALLRAVTRPSPEKELNGATPEPSHLVLALAEVEQHLQIALSNINATGNAL